MTEEKEMIYGSGQAKRKAYLSYLPIAVFLICIAAGTYFGGNGGTVVRLDNPFHKDVSFFFTCAQVCFGDIVHPLLIGVGAGQRLFVPVTTAVGALRGAALGAAVSFCTENALPGAAVGMTASFGAVSVLLLCYGIFTHHIASETGFLYRLLCYFAVTGAVTLLRLLPYVLL